MKPDEPSPSEPSGVTGIHVRNDVDGRELLESVVDASEVRGLSVGALQIMIARQDGLRRLK